MKGWLDQYQDDGNMQEYQPNYNDSKVTTPPNFEGLGNLTTGYNYNSSWGGSFQNGGGIPGSVGFTYARIGSTPSNGKHAKKTKSSAKNGDELGYQVSGTKFTDEQGQKLDSLSNRLRDLQYEQTQDFEKAYPNIPTNEILSTANTDKDFRNYNIDQKADSLTSIYGNKYIPISEDYKNTSRDYSNIILNAGKTQNVIGNTEQGLKNFGYRSMLYKYSHDQGSPAYKDLEKKQNGGEMRFYQEGLDFKPKMISQDGSIIKDDNGYWNPDNIGEVVEIGSNNITMKGVHQNLLGISNTGDVQIMSPGKDYKFRGVKVIEYPLAKDGKQLKLLDQLINFNNFGQSKKNWLSKYE